MYISLLIITAVYT